MSENPRKVVPWILYLVFFSVLNETVFNISTPRIAEQFGLGPAGVGWVMTIFLAIFGIGSMIYGKLADILSLRGLVAAGVAIYCAGSALGLAFGYSYPAVIASRAIQGMGASAIPALVAVIVARFFPPGERGGLFGLVASVASVGIAIGPVIGGLVSRELGWRWLFALPLLSLVALPAIVRGLPREPRREGGLDFAGAFFATLAVGALVLSLATGSWIALAALCVSMGAFVFRIRTARKPFASPRLFVNAPFRDSLAIAFCLFSAVMGVFFLGPLMLHAVHGLGSAEIGLALFPGALGSALAGPLGGRLVDRRGSAVAATLGLVLVVSGMVVLALVLGLSPTLIAAAMIPIYTGFALIQTAMVNRVSQTLPAADSGVGMGLFNLVAVVSGAAGTTLAGKALEGRWLYLAPAGVWARLPAGPYTGILLLFAAVVAVGGCLYLRGLRGGKAAGPCAAGPTEACLDS